ncbi:kinase-like domain-containing protein [Xylariaceae sp. FL0804]|nr:kinase-like domain-containing protein [Xylariaceae sp. FL0804]
MATGGLTPRRSTRLRRPVLTTHERLRRYFEQDNHARFEFEGLHGSGGQASVYKVRYKCVMTKSLVLKLADPGKMSDAEGILRERNTLKRLAGCRHITQMRDIPDDPLESSRADVGWTWLYLEAIENGSLGSLMLRAKEAGLTSLPNRLLWRLFLCIIRACIAMAWPRNSPDENETTRVQLSLPTGITHNDFHGDNLMFGPLMEAPEHDLTPILKLIDFGLAEIRERKRHAEYATGEQNNVEDIGIIMATLIFLQTDSKWAAETIEVDLSRLRRASDVPSPARGLLAEWSMHPHADPCPHVDLDLRRVVAACMAEDAAVRPSLAELETWAYSEVCNTAPAYFVADGGAAFESDDAIRRIVQLCIFDARTTGRESQ